MCKKWNHSGEEHGPVLHGRRDFLKAGAVLVSAPLMISTVPRAYPMQQFMNPLRLDGTPVNIGALEQLKDLDGMLIGFGRKILAG